MATDSSATHVPWFSRFIAVGKDLVSLLRDAALFLLAVLLVAFPIQFNSILVDAGFEEGSLVGFKWKSKLVESNRPLQDAQATISDLQTKNDDLRPADEERRTAKGTGGRQREARRHGAEGAHREAGRREPPVA